jgi:hypothetical protein
MKAIGGAKYGPPELLRFEDLDKPFPKDDEVLIEVRAASINKDDYILIRGKPFIVRLFGGGLLRPKDTIPVRTSRAVSKPWERASPASRPGMRCSAISQRAVGAPMPSRSAPEKKTLS